MTSLLLDTNWSTQSVPFITVPLFARCSFTHRFHAFFWPHFPPPFFSAESQGRLTFQMGEKGGHMVVKTTVSPSPEERKVKQKEWQEGKEEGNWMYWGFSRTCLSAAFRFYTAASAGGNTLFVIRGSNSDSHNKPASRSCVCLAVYEKTKKLNLRGIKRTESCLYVIMS